MTNRYAPSGPRVAEPMFLFGAQTQKQDQQQLPRAFNFRNKRDTAPSPPTQSDVDGSRNSGSYPSFTQPTRVGEDSSTRKQGKPKAKRAKAKGVNQKAQGNEAPKSKAERKAQRQVKHLRLQEKQHQEKLRRQEQKRKENEQSQGHKLKQDERRHEQWQRQEDATQRHLQLQMQPLSLNDLQIQKVPTQPRQHLQNQQPQSFQGLQTQEVPTEPRQHLLNQQVQSLPGLQFRSAQDMQGQWFQPRQEEHTYSLSSRSHFRGGRGGSGNRANNQARRNYLRYKAGASERDLLRGQRGPTPEQMEGMVEGPARFMDLDEVSVSSFENDVFDIGDAQISEEGEVCEPVAKRARVSEAQSDAQAVPRWSNPDPYTVLPPIDESVGKRKDVVQLIRKAKTATINAKRNAIADGDDFISFNFDEPAETPEPVKFATPLKPSRFDVPPPAFKFNIPAQAIKPEVDAAPDVSVSEKRKQDFIVIDDNSDDDIVITGEGQSGREDGVARPSQGSKFSHLDTLHPNRHQSLITKEPFSIPLPPKPQISQKSANGSDSVGISQWPPPFQHPPPSSGSTQIAQSGAGRKRGHNEYEEYSSTLGDSIGSLKSGSAQSKSKHNVLPEWRPRPHMPRHPWIRSPYSSSEDASARLHREICDFYDFLKPQQFENTLRQDLVTNLQAHLNKILPGAELRYFGSFAAGMYLPEGDMDLVVFTHRFLTTGYATTGHRHMFDLKESLTRSGIARSGSAIVIKARVPLVKYIDARTGLKVDVSFDNDTGVKANETYRLWKEQFPAMPMLVTLMKQFLLMRNLNEVHTGGLGGFSVACLVVSLMQLSPSMATHPRDPNFNLGTIFMSFLDYYGNKFNLMKSGIRLNPPGLFEKASDRYFLNMTSTRKHQNHNAVKLAIVDPNNADNDISSGSRGAARIFEEFGVAFAAMQERIRALGAARQDSRDDGSVLGIVYAGNYSSFDRQRALLRSLYERGQGSVSLR